jgi:hypothetical protein
MRKKDKNMDKNTHVCSHCHVTINREQVLSDFRELFDFANAFGLEALTEQQQALYEGTLCPECAELCL